MVSKHQSILGSGFNQISTSHQEVMKMIAELKDLVMNRVPIANSSPDEHVISDQLRPPPAPPHPQPHPFYSSEFSPPSLIPQFNTNEFTASYVFDESSAPNWVYGQSQFSPQIYNQQYWSPSYNPNHMSPLYSVDQQYYYSQPQPLVPHAPQHPYTLTVQTTLSTGQPYYTIEPTTVFENVHSFVDLRSGNMLMNACESNDKLEVITESTVKLDVEVVDKLEARVVCEGVPKNRMLVKDELGVKIEDRSVLETIDDMCEADCEIESEMKDEIRLEEDDRSPCEDVDDTSGFDCRILTEAKIGCEVEIRSEIYRSDNLTKAYTIIEDVDLSLKTLGMDYEQTTKEFHPSLSDSDRVKIVSDDAIERLAVSIQTLQEIKIQRMQRLQDLAAYMLEPWNLMDTAIDAIETGVMDPAYILEQIELQISKVKDEVRSRKEIHGFIVRRELMTNHIGVNGLLDVYRRCKDINSAVNIFSQFSVRNIVSYNTMIVAYCETGDILNARRLFDQMELAGLKKDIISWNLRITGYVDNSMFTEVLTMFIDLLMHDGVEINSFTLGSALAACTDMGLTRLGKEIHSHAIIRGLHSNTFVGGSLVDMYSKCQDPKSAQIFFYEVTEKDMATWNALISVYSRCNQIKNIQISLQEMRKEGCEPNVYTWNGIIAGHVENDLHEMALDMFSQMHNSNLQPDIYTVGTIIPSCSRLATLERGKQVHAHSVRFGYESDCYIGATLVDMYAKCGSIKHCHLAYKRILSHTLVTRNSMLNAYAMHGHGEEGIAFFRKMLIDGFVPDNVTFLSVLSSYVHAGSVDMGKKLEIVEDVPCENTIAIIGLDQFITKGAILAHEKELEAHSLEAMKFSASPVVCVAVQYKVASDLSKLAEGLTVKSKFDKLEFGGARMLLAKVLRETKGAERVWKVIRDSQYHCQPWRTLSVICDCSFVDLCFLNSLSCSIYDKNE